MAMSTVAMRASDDELIQGYQARYDSEPSFCYASLCLYCTRCSELGALDAQRPLSRGVHSTGVMTLWVKGLGRYRRLFISCIPCIYCV